METATAMALRQPIRFRDIVAAATFSSTKEIGTSSGKLVHLRLWRAKNRVLSSGFCDQGHLQHYKSSLDSSAAATVEGLSGRRMSGTEEKSVKKKKQLKLLKRLSRDLSTFSEMGYGLDCNVKGNMIREATQFLLEQLQKVKAEEKEAKKTMKEEKARKKAATRV